MGRHGFAQKGWINPIALARAEHKGGSAGFEKDGVTYSSMRDYFNRPTRPSWDDLKKIQDDKDTKAHALEKWEQQMNEGFRNELDKARESKMAEKEKKRKRKHSHHHRTHERHHKKREKKRRRPSPSESSQGSGGEDSSSTEGEQSSDTARRVEKHPRKEPVRLSHFFEREEEHEAHTQRKESRRRHEHMSRHKHHRR